MSKNINGDSNHSICILRRSMNPTMAADVVIQVFDEAQRKNCLDDTIRSFLDAGVRPFLK